MREDYYDEARQAVRDDEWYEAWDEYLDSEDDSCETEQGTSP